MGNIDNAAPNSVIFIQFKCFMGPKCSKGATIKDFFIVQQEMGRAARNAGWLLKAAIEDDPCRRYETKKEALTRMYRWVKE